MAAEYVGGWSGIVKEHFNSNIALTTINSDGLTFDAYFSTKDLYIHGKQCSYSSVQYILRDHVPIGTPIHFNAHRFNTPVYSISPYVWYKATLVWIGKKPLFDNGRNDDSDDTDTCSFYDPNLADVWCQSGRVIKFCNKNRTAILASVIDNRNTFVALELCRFYCYDKDDEEFYQPNNLTEELDIDDWVQFEAFQLYAPFSGIGYRVGLAWNGCLRPNYNLNKPTHLLKL